MKSIPARFLMTLTAPIATIGLAAAQPAIPDMPRDGTYWIVLAGGQRISAVGAFEVKPPVVWFRALNGVLLSMKLDLVDLDATRAANQSASPLAARNVEIVTPAVPLPRPPTPAGRVGVAGEAAKRAGKTGTFTDLSGRAVASPAPPAVKPRQRKRDSG